MRARRFLHAGRIRTGFVHNGWARRSRGGQFDEQGRGEAGNHIAYTLLLLLLRSAIQRDAEWGGVTCHGGGRESKNGACRSICRRGGGGEGDVLSRTKDLLLL